MNWPGMKSSGWPSSRTNAKWRMLGASMRLETSLRGKWTGTGTHCGRGGRARLYRHSPRGPATRGCPIQTGRPSPDGPIYAPGLRRRADRRCTRTGTTATQTPALSVRDLRKTYDNGVEALKGVSLDVAPGDFFALLGPNGAGKSTLIGIVSSLVNASERRACACSASTCLRAARGAMRLIGLVPQELNFNMFEKPFDILVNYAGFYGIPRAQALVRAEEELQARAAVGQGAR
jgi:hypothetical protein